jgi:ABC-type polysaccharide/polyol phosphate transport system ATPase subunit
MRDSEIAIKLQGISKCFQIYDKPHHRLMQGLLRGKKQYFKEFWALQDISFEIKKGETVGIIGRNGSGKSTLLQIICGTLSPSAGSVDVNGRVAALLELGSGFNPEFTGRENIYMNASILGLSPTEIAACFDDIVNFADIGDFIEQPVKTYSSGMMVRLAFAVSVHTKPDILVVDEALSVGDVAFQNKCMAKIKAIKETGTSILFVSHDLSTVQIVCDRVIWMKNGNVKLSGYAVDVCQEYYVDNVNPTGNALSTEEAEAVIVQQITGLARFSTIKVVNDTGEPSNIFNVGSNLRFEFTLEAETDLEESVIAISIYRADGDWLIGQTSREKNVVWSVCAAGETLQGQLRLAPLCLASGDYKVVFGAYSTDHKICYALTDFAASFSVRTNYQTWGKFVHPCEWINH